MKILRVISHLNIGGVQRQMLRVFQELKKLGVECQVCCLDEPGRLAPEFAEQGFTVHHIRFTNRLDPLGLWRLRRLILKENFDVVHSQMYASNMSLNTAMWGLRRPVLINGYHNQLYTSSERQHKKVTASASKPHGFLAVGESVKQALIQGGIPDFKITVVTNGVEIPAGEYSYPTRSVNEPLQVYWAGRFVSQKKPAFFLDVAESLKSRGASVQFTLFGEGPQWKEVSAAVESRALQDVIHIPGATTELFEAIRPMEVFVSASYREGFPNALLEALVAGKPALVSRIDPHTEVLEGSEAGLCLPVEVELWVEQLHQWSQHREELKQRSIAARSLGLEHSIQNTAQKTLQYYTKLLAQNT
jgi:glycosyltransferase involved in cell wall biosynthesis